MGQKFWKWGQLEAPYGQIQPCLGHCHAAGSGSGPPPLHVQIGMGQAAPTLPVPPPTSNLCVQIGAAPPSISGLEMFCSSCHHYASGSGLPCPCPMPPDQGCSIPHTPVLPDQGAPCPTSAPYVRTGTRLLFPQKVLYQGHSALLLPVCPVDGSRPGCATLHSWIRPIGKKQERSVLE